MEEPQQKDKRIEDLVPSGFFVLRTPLLPVEEFLGWTGRLKFHECEDNTCSTLTQQSWREDVKVLRDRLRKIIDRPEILQALFIASPSLESSIDAWKCAPDTKKGIQTERALVRYFVRMCARPTPFGLFSGCSAGVVSREQTEEGELTIRPRNEYRFTSRLDFDYLFALTTSLRRDPVIAATLKYQPNSSLHKVHNVWHYVESRLAVSGRTHHLVKVDGDPYLEAVLKRAEAGASFEELVCVLYLGPDDTEISKDEANEYIQELIENEVLVSSFSPLLTGAPPLDDIITQLESIAQARSIAQTLISARERMTEMDRRGLGSSPTEYRELAATLENLPAKVDIARLYQVDMTKPLCGGVLPKIVVDELVQGVELWCRIGRTEEADELRAFRDAFSARHERAWVPLLEALDPETGVGFGQQSAFDGSPLLRGLRLGSSTSTMNSGLDFQALLFRKITQRAPEGTLELQLDPADVPPLQAQTAAS